MKHQMSKVVIVGKYGSGKTSILNRYVYDKFHNNEPVTIGIECTHTEHDAHTKFVLWDTAGQERFQSVTSSLYRGAHAIIFVYDVTDIESFYELNQWMRNYRACGNMEKSVAILLGNKLDLKRVVSKEDALGWAAKHKMCYEEVSACTGENVRSAFSTIVRQLGTLPEVREVKQRLKENLSKSDRCCY
tara:strand:+ start:2863 stop:3426 length:564 start_codon:yes stop_codon:yes gene_type:complete